MASPVLDVSELDDFAGGLSKTAQSIQKKQKPFLRKEGTKLKSWTLQEARKVKKKTGRYLKSIKRGKVYPYDGAQAVRVYSAAPHAHLIEDGHRMVTHDGREVGFVPGHHVFETAGKAFDPQYQRDVEDFLDEEVRKL